MTITDIIKAFSKEVTRPVNIEGDPFGIDATTEEITKLVNKPSDQLTANDFSGYLGYCTTGGDDDLRFLFPSILRIWESELYKQDSWFTQYFHAELCRTDFIERALSERLKTVTIEFMVRALSDRLNSETALHVSGSSTHHNWFGQIASFGVYTKKIDMLWELIWNSKKQGHTVAILQYLSCILYDTDNPIFTPWTCKKGGGAPTIWEYNSVGFKEHWKSENLKYLSKALCSDTIRKWLNNTHKRFDSQCIRKMAQDFIIKLDTDVHRVDQRCANLISALSIPT